MSKQSGDLMHMALETAEDTISRLLAENTQHIQQALDLQDEEKAPPEVSVTIVVKLKKQGGSLTGDASIKFTKERVNAGYKWITSPQDNLPGV